MLQGRRQSAQIRVSCGPLAFCLPLLQSRIVPKINEELKETLKTPHIAFLKGS
jgi:hypothetical protein